MCQLLRCTSSLMMVLGAWTKYHNDNWYQNWWFDKTSIEMTEWNGGELLLYPFASWFTIHTCKRIRGSPWTTSNMTREISYIQFISSTKYSINLISCLILNIPPYLTHRPPRWDKLVQELKFHDNVVRVRNEWLKVFFGEYHIMLKVSLSCSHPNMWGSFYATFG